MGEATDIKELTDYWGGRGGRSYMFNSTQLYYKFLRLSAHQRSRRKRSFFFFFKVKHAWKFKSCHKNMTWLKRSTTLAVDCNLFMITCKGSEGDYQSQPKVSTCKTWFHPTVKFDFQSLWVFFGGVGRATVWNNYLLKSADQKNNIPSQVIPFIGWFGSSGKAKQRHNALQPQQLGWKLLQIVRRSCKLEIGNEKVRNDSLKKKKDKLLQRPYSLNRWSKTCLFDLFVCLLQKCYFGILGTQSVNFSASALSWLLRAV